MFLTSAHVLWPVARMGVFVVEETPDAELFSGGAVPTGPIPGARCFMAKDPVQPVAVLRADGGI